MELIELEIINHFICCGCSFPVLTNILSMTIVKQEAVVVTKTWFSSQGLTSPCRRSITNRLAALLC